MNTIDALARRQAIRLRNTSKRARIKEIVCELAEIVEDEARYLDGELSESDPAYSSIYNLVFVSETLKSLVKKD